MYRLLSGYNRILEAHPYKTQSATAAVLWCCGDLLSQAIEHHQKPSAASISAHLTGTGGGGNGNGDASNPTHALTVPSVATAAAVAANRVTRCDPESELAGISIAALSAPSPASLLLPVAGATTGATVIPWHADELLVAATAPAAHGAEMVREALASSSVTVNNPMLAMAHEHAVDPRFRVDWSRLATMTGFGLVIAGPLYTFWYAKLDHVVNHHFAQRAATAAARGTPVSPKSLQRRILGTKLFADLCIFDPPYLTFFFTSTSLVSGMQPSAIWAQYKRDALSTYKVDVSVWAPIQFVNFSRVPVHLQPVMVNGVNVFWNAFLSYVGHSH
ncbi:hypothetical protein BC828DRAFT_407375 [Blastocladiella britannica]|nr:hypothetical protein BC828DRAFT_407375 [Blastocladiella britannica]